MSRQLHFYVLLRLTQFTFETEVFESVEDCFDMVGIDHGLVRSNFMISFESQSIIEKFHFVSFGVEKHGCRVVKVGNP